ncbi:PREDICTED: fibronectin type-III domain-containing protein 3a-like isoform X1 [Papilio xuthus]|uniref:Fibronectin type-III domain-containing protein 3a-like isoform X1 n=1 Tax=Papilio xuthus TaxID=66420 RepID=A0AAJ6ZXF4_PAPXU|nr:PREDICTED: fibronectin type-III domain-containing protein 3a-like isoform X1 [Papilio xuthus]
MVGVGVAEGGGGGAGGGPPEGYYGDYYPPEYYVPPEMCPHPQHPQHAHMCAVHTEYGGMPVVTSATMMPAMMPPVLDEGLRHYLLHPHAQHAHHPHHQPPHHQPPHHQPPHHQPPHHYGPTNGAGGPQHFYGAGYPTHYHHVPAHHMQHSPPPPVYQKDERAQRQYSKLKQKLERKQTNRNNGVEMNSGASTPSLSPRKELNGRGGGSGGGSGSGGASSGAWSEGEGSSAGASVQGDDDNDTQAFLDLLSATRTPQVSDITPTSALVQWNSPLPEGVSLPNVELTYELLLGDRGRYKAIYSGPSLSCRVRDLRPGCEYSVCLQIRAGEQTGAASEAATFRAPAAPPGRMLPARLANRARTSLLLRWSPPADNGARILHYVLEMDAGEGFAEVTHPRTRQHTVNNLRTQTCYRFRIAAVNECGRGEWSDEFVGWTLGAPPPAPAPPLLRDAAADSLALAWERQADEEFTLQMDEVARGHGFLPIYTGTECSYVCTALRRASDYRFRLRCENADGQGPWSQEVTYRTLPERPGAPGRPTPKGKIHSRAFRLRWEPPTDDGGAAVENYTLEIDGGEGYQSAYNGAEREAHCDRLQPGIQYRARVRCANVAGESDWSAAETITTEATCPGACSAPEVVAEPRATLVSVRWRPPDCNGGAPLTEYRAEIVGEDGIVRTVHSALESECTVRELQPGCEYRLWVVACNKVGAGLPSPALHFSTAPAPPDAPETPVAYIENARTIRLEWRASRDNGAPIADYRLEMSLTNMDDSFTEVYRGPETACIVSKLVPFSPYFFRVCATNSAGRGAWSGVRDLLTPRAPPGAPTGIKHEATAESLRLHWRCPASHGAEILGYRVQVDESDFETDGPTPEKVVEGLRPDTTYRVRVAALNELGLGDWSEEAQAATRPRPPAPPDLRCAQLVHNYIKLEWDSRGEGALYCVEMRGNGEFRPVYRGSARSCKVKKLREGTTYSFRIRASDDRGGRGSWGDVVTATTPPAPPPALRPPTVLVLAPRRAAVAWDTLEDAEYVLQCARAKDAVFKQVYAGRETQFTVDELEPGAEYLLRACAVRGGLAGAWSPVARVLVPVPAAAPRPRRAKPARALSPRRMALLMAAGFLLLAVLVAMVVQRLVDPQP